MVLLQTDAQVNLQHAWDDCYTQWLESRRSDNTRRSYERAVKDFLDFSGVSLQQANRSHFLAWANDLKKRGLKPATRSARLGALNYFYHFASTEYFVRVEGKQTPLCENNPVHLRTIRPKVKTYANSRALTAAEVKKFLGQPDQNRITGMRDFALLSGYLILGRRNTEWRLARIMDFEMRDGGIFYRWSGKGKTDELIDVPSELWTILHRYVNASGGRDVFDYIFLDRTGSHPISDQRVRDLVNRYAGLAGLGSIRVHDLRHTAAMLRREAGADVEEIRDFLGHSSLVTTQVYLHRITGKQNERGGAVCKLISILDPDIKITKNQAKSR